MDKNIKEKLVKYKELFTNELFDSCIPFWLEHGNDVEYGGVINCLDRYGNVYSEDKSVWMQGRTAWTFAKLCNTFGYKKEWADFSRSCLDFIEAHCIDTDGRMFFTVTRDGRPLRKRRYWFSESFYIIACAEYYILSGERRYLDTAKKYFDLIYGIYRDHSKDPYHITPKSYAETRNMKSLAEPMILLNVCSVVNSAEHSTEYDEIAKLLVEDVRNFYKPELNALLESVSVDDQYVSESSAARIVNPGHDIECSWFLLDEAVYSSDASISYFAETVFNNAINFGWDKEYGGILYFKDIEGKPVEAYEHDMKLWWPHNEAIIASLKFFINTGKNEYLEWFEKCTEYAFSHFSEPEFGEWLGYLRRDGKPTEPPCKGHTYKGAFHVMRMLIICIDLLNNI